MIIPGAGHLYHGQTRRGAIAFGAITVAWIVAFTIAVGGSLFITVITLGLGAFLSVVFWLALLVPPLGHLAAGYDAYTQLEKIQAGELPPPESDGF